MESVASVLFILGSLASDLAKNGFSILLDE